MRALRVLVLLSFTLMVVSGALAAAAVPLDQRLTSYIARPEPQFKWTKTDQAQAGAGSVYKMVMTSQVWRGIPWEHAITVFVPARVEFPDMALLLVSGGGGKPRPKISPGDEESQIGGIISGMIGAPVAVLTHVPNEPLFDNLSEDALISYTYVNYLADGDPTWPLLFPMAKSAVKAMDAVQALLAQETKAKITRFMVTGGSKRGWTTWLTGASGDPRVKCIAPMVIDTLNMAAQMPHQLAMWGKYSEQIDDYTKRGVQQKMGSPRGQELLAMVDPYSYRARLTMPKLLINGANDRYWATDALTLYWDGLVGPKSVMYAPNSGHGLEDRGRVVASMVAFFRANAAGKPFPTPTWKHGEAGDQLTLRMASTPAPSGGRIWMAPSASKDFRESKWVSVPMRLEGGALVGEIAKPASGSVALFGEADYTMDGRTFTLSTAPRVFPPVVDK